MDDADEALILQAPNAASLDLSPARRWSIFALLLTSEFFYGWSWNSVDVLRPFLRRSLDLGLMQAGSLYSAQGAGALCGTLLLGQLADRFGRRHLLVVVMLGYGLMLLAGIAVQSYAELLAQRFLLGVFAGASFPVSVGIYVTLFPPRTRGRLAGILNASFSASIIALGLAIGFVDGADWTSLFWIGGVPPLLLGLLAPILIPDHQSLRPSRMVSRIPVRELFNAPYRIQTVALALMTGLNFFGYQAYDGWLTTYLENVRRLSPGVSGHVMAWQFAGNVCGGFAWGLIGDRLGRRFNAVGFLGLAVLIVLFLVAPGRVPVLCGIGFLSGAALCSSVIWGPWFAELYPAHLRSTAASIFHWGRVISFFAPLVTADVARSYGLATAMSLGCAAFVAAAIIWRSQRETLVRLLVASA